MQTGELHHIVWQRNHTPTSAVQYSSPRDAKTVRECVVISSASASFLCSQKQCFVCCPAVLLRACCFGDGNGCSFLFGSLSLSNGRCAIAATLVRTIRTSPRMLRIAMGATSFGKREL